jgi:hypothetical protein
MRKDLNFSKYFLVVEFALFCHDLHPNVDCVTVFLYAKMLTFKVLGDFVGTLNRILDFVAGNICSIHLLHVNVDYLVEIQSSNFDGELNKPVPIRMESEVIIRVDKDTEYFFEL